MNCNRLLPALCLLLPCAAAAMPPLFADTAELAVRITAPLGRVQAERDSGEYHAGSFEFTAGDGSPQVVDVELRARGNYRRRERTCPFPPIRLNFKKKQLEGTLLDGQDKLKLVTHCRTGSERYEQQLLKEYLAYRMLAAVTERSFGTRLLRVTWIDSDAPAEPVLAYAFLIEDEDRLGERLGLEPGGVQRIAAEHLDGSQAALVAVFQYLIGNTDYSMLAGPADEDCCHNAVLYRDGELYVPIPYDFDFSGFVDAPYAEPNPRLRIRSVTDRLYRGHCVYGDALEPAVERFRAARTEILGLVAGETRLTEGVRDRGLRFIEGFFELADNPRRVRSRLTRKCV